MAGEITNKETSDTAKFILAEVARAKHFAQSRQINEIFLSAETITSLLAFLVGPKLDAEKLYRVLRQEFITNGASAAAAEAAAKATDEYFAWRKLEHVYELGHEQIMLLKRFGPLLQEEYNRS